MPHATANAIIDRCLRPTACIPADVSYCCSRVVVPPFGAQVLTMINTQQAPYYHKIKQIRLDLGTCMQTMITTNNTNNNNRRQDDVGPSLGHHNNKERRDEPCTTTPLPSQNRLMLRVETTAYKNAAKRMRGTTNTTKNRNHDGVEGRYGYGGRGGGEGEINASQRPGQLTVAAHCCSAAAL